ncbi:2787_t:CDS:1, partial [Gigaspora rosea]
IFKPEINLTFHKQDSVQVSTDSSRPEGSLLHRPEGATLKGHSSSSKDNNVLLEEWHAPAGFSPDFSLSSEDDFLQNKSLDDKSEIQNFTSSLNHCEAGHFVSDQ